MKEEVISYLYDWVKSQGYKKSKEDFVQLLHSNDEAFNQAFNHAKEGGYKKDENSFGILVGKNKQSNVVTETAPVTETVTEEPRKELRGEEMATVEAKPAPQEQAETPSADMSKMPKMEVKEVTAAVKKELKKEIPAESINQNLLPVTEKTEVKAIETPSDKMVVKSEAKVEPKTEEVAESGKIKVKSKGKKELSANPMETIEVKGKESEMPKVEIPKFDIINPNESYKPYGEKGPDVYYSKEKDQYIIKNGDERIIVEKGSQKYNEIDKKIGESVKNTTENSAECPGVQGGCPKNRIAVIDYFLKNIKRDSIEDDRQKIVDREGNLANFIDDAFDGTGVVKLEEEDFYDHGRYGGYYFISEEPPKSKRFSVYKPFGEENTSIIYDNNTGVIMKEENDYKIKSEDGKPMKTWLNVPFKFPEYKELKSLIDGLNYKKEKGKKNTFVAPPTETQFAPDWLKK
jgi:hypothetical protein